jgi:hypothetical protein
MTELMIALNTGKEVWHTFKDRRDGHWYYYTRDNFGGERYFLTVEEIAALEDKTVLDSLYEAMKRKEIIVEVD